MPESVACLVDQMVFGRSADVLHHRSVGGKDTYYTLRILQTRQRFPADGYFSGSLLIRD